MKRTCLCLLLLVCLICTGCGASEEYARTASIRKIGQMLNIDLSEAECIFYRDTHGGFHGDGELALCMQLPGAYTGTLPSRYWQELPMTEHIRQKIFRENGNYNGFAINCPLPEGIVFPEPDAGCWFIFDRYGVSWREDPYPAGVNRYSGDSLKDYGFWNYSCAWIDAETNRLYYIEHDM